MSMAVTLKYGSLIVASRFLTGLVTCFDDARHDLGLRLLRSRSVRAGRHADQFGEARAERAERRAADGEAHVGDAQVAATQQRHRPLDAPRHQIAVRRLAVGQLELAAEVTRRHVARRGRAPRRRAAARTPGPSGPGRAAATRDLRDLPPLNYHAFRRRRTPRLCAVPTWQTLAPRRRGPYTCRREKRCRSTRSDSRARCPS